MQVTDVQNFLTDKYGANNIKYLGCGSDSVAFCADGYVFRFTDKNPRLYQREAEICQFLRPYISIEIPDIEFVNMGDLFYARHKMLTGRRWHWHAFMWKPRKQKKLAISCAQFFAQLHAVNVENMRRVVPDIDSLGYMDFETVRPFMAQFVPNWMLNFFARHYARIVDDARTKTDLVVVHLGLKGANSVCNTDGSLCGVYDFGNCGVYERSRDFVPFLMGGNRRLYRQVCRAYQKLSGVKIDARRVRDLAELEFMFAKRWVVRDDGMAVSNSGFCQRRLAAAMLHFCHLPRFVLRPLLLHYMTWYARHNTGK